MLVKSPLEFDEAAIRSFSEKYIMSLESEFLASYNRIKNAPRRNLEQQTMNRIFSERDLLAIYPNPMVLDVGSSRICAVGSLSPEEGHTVTLRSCDVLAGAYAMLNSMFGLKPYVETEFAFVERLTDKFPENSFDIVRMSNALDHCYDPFTGIFEMLKVAKIGGTVRLIHHENESVYELEYGMHQWNITSGGENSMVIWRKGFTADIRDILGEAAEIRTQKQQRNDGTYVIKSDIVKLQDIQTPPKKGMNIFDETMIMFCLMKTSARFSAAYKKAGNADPFRKSLFRKVIAYAPMSLRKYVPSWLEKCVRNLSRRIGY